MASANKTLVLNIELKYEYDKPPMTLQESIEREYADTTLSVLAEQLRTEILESLEIRRQTHEDMVQAHEEAIRARLGAYKKKYPNH